jgi:hypothetical protein
LNSVHDLRPQDRPIDGIKFFGFSLRKFANPLPYLDTSIVGRARGAYERQDLPVAPGTLPTQLSAGTKTLDEEFHMQAPVHLLVLGIAFFTGLVAFRPAASSETGSEPAPPSSRAATQGSWPNAANTGVPEGTVLTIVEGDLTIRTAGTVIDSKDIRGCVGVAAPGVVIRRSKVRCTSDYAVLSGGYKGARLLIEDSEVDCRNASGVGTQTTGIGDNNFIARRLNIHHCVNGFDVDNDVTIQDTWIHDLYDGGPDPHPDGIQIAIGRNLLIENNAIVLNGGMTSAIISHRTDMNGVIIRNNLLGGGAYTLYCPSERSVDVRIIGNRFSTLYYPKAGEYGPWTDCDKVAELRDNVWDSTGQLLLGQPIPRQ